MLTSILNNTWKYFLFLHMFLSCGLCGHASALACLCGSDGNVYELVLSFHQLYSRKLSLDFQDHQQGLYLVSYFVDPRWVSHKH